MEPPLKTRITELYGIRLPVIASGLMWLATPEYVGAAVNAGIMGFMTAAILPHIMGTNAHAAYATGEYEKAMLSCGQRVVFADRIESFAAIVARIETEARDALARLDGLRVAPPAAAAKFQRA